MWLNLYVVENIRIRLVDRLKAVTLSLTFKQILKKQLARSRRGKHVVIRYLTSGSRQ